MHYAVKANPHPVLLRALVREGASFDVASPAEVQRLSRRRRPTRRPRLLQPHQAARGHRLESAALGVRLFVVDSPEETRKVAEAAPGIAVLCRIVTSGSGSDWPLSRKYGCSTSEAVEVLRLAAGLGLDPAGVSFHVGSQQRDPSAWDAPIEASSRVFAALRQATDCGRGCSTWAAASRPRSRAVRRRSTRTARRSGARCASASARVGRAP